LFRIDALAVGVAPPEGRHMFVRRTRAFESKESGEPENEGSTEPEGNQTTQSKATSTTMAMTTTATAA